jgi:hypothetical protein
MTQYQKIWLIGFLTIVIAIMISLIYASKTSDDWRVIQRKINNLTIDQVECILIGPSNPDWKVNLTTDTFKIANTSALTSMINIISQIDEKYGGKAAGGEWDGVMIIKFKNGDELTLLLRDSIDGFFIKLQNVMGHQLYYCNDLKTYLENYTNYKEPVGGRNGR